MAMEKAKDSKKIDGVSRRQKEEDIFVDLEKSKRNFSVFWTLIALILLVFFSTLIFIAVKLKRIDITSKSIEAETNIDSFSDRVSGIRGFGLSTMKFSGKEFLTASGADSEEFPLKNTSYSITKDEIILHGKLKDSFIPLDLKIKLIPAAKDKKFSFLIAPNAVENIVIYGQTKEKIEKIINDNINGVLDKNGLIASGVTTSDDRIEMKVIKDPK